MVNRKSLFSFPIAVLIATSFLLSLSAAATKNEKNTTTKEKTGDTRTGIASWYGPNFHGKKTATGDKFDMLGLTCASNQYPLGTWLKVTNVRNGKTVVVRVNDRMHPRMKRLIDLSKGAAKEIGIISTGVAKVKVEDLGKSLPATLP